MCGCCKKLPPTQAGVQDAGGHSSPSDQQSCVVFSARSAAGRCAWSDLAGRLPHQAFNLLPTPDIEIVLVQVLPGYISRWIDRPTDRSIKSPNTYTHIAPVATHPRWVDGRRSKRRSFSCRTCATRTLSRPSPSRAARCPRRSSRDSSSGRKTLGRKGDPAGDPSCQLQVPLHPGRPRA